MKVRSMILKSLIPKVPKFPNPQVILGILERKTQRNKNECGFFLSLQNLLFIEKLFHFHFSLGVMTLKWPKALGGQNGF